MKAHLKYNLDILYDIVLTIVYIQKYWPEATPEVAKHGTKSSKISRWFAQFLTRFTLVI